MSLFHLTRQRMCNLLNTLSFFYFIVFMIPESFWIFVCPNLQSVSFSQKFISNMVEKSSFPVSIYLFWILTPIVMVFFFVICVMMIWPSPEFEKFLVRREGKNLIGASLGVVAIFIGVLFIEDTSSFMYTTIQPFKFKLSFFLIYGGCALGASAALAVFVAELKARLLLRNN